MGPSQMGCMQHSKSKKSRAHPNQWPLSVAVAVFVAAFGRIDAFSSSSTTIASTRVGAPRRLVPSASLSRGGGSSNRPENRGGGDGIVPPSSFSGYGENCRRGLGKPRTSPLHVAFSTGPTPTTNRGKPPRSESALPRLASDGGPPSTVSDNPDPFFPFPSDSDAGGVDLVAAGDVVNGTHPGGGSSPHHGGAREEELRGLVAMLSEKIGSVDEDRMYHPELASGEVTRLFSNLKYEKTSSGGVAGKVTASAHAAGSVLGAAALVAGSTAGVGALAIPAATAPAGFLPTSAAMLFAWGYMVASGLLLSELALNRIGETGRTTGGGGGGILGLYNDALRDKPWAAAVGNAAYFFLHYAVATACIARGGDVLAGLLSATAPGLEGTLALIPGGHQLLFACIAGLTFSVAKPTWVKDAGNVAAAGMAATFLGIVGATVAASAGSVDYGAVVSLSNQHPERVLDAVPTLFLSLVYQNVIPGIVTRLEGDRQKITRAILLGTGLPAAMFLVWNAVALGSVYGGADAASLIESGADPIMLMQNVAGSSPVLGPLIGVFSALAVATSLVGVVRGLCDASLDVVGLPMATGRYEPWKPLLVGGILVPPLAVCMAGGNPDIFLQSLNIGGTFGVSTLFLILPALLVWETRYGENKDEPIWTLPLVPGGKLSLASLWKAAATLIVEQGAEKLGIIDWAKEQITHFT